MIKDIVFTRKQIRFTCSFHDLSGRTRKWISGHAKCTLCKTTVENCRCDLLGELSIDISFGKKLGELYVYENKRFHQKQSKIKRLSRLKRADGCYKESDIKTIFELQSGKCYYCKSNLTDDSGKLKYEIDHIQPLSKGGTNWPSNLSLSCRSCNLSKGPQLENDFWKAAKKMYGPEIISFSKKDNRKHTIEKKQLDHARKKEITDMYIYPDSPFSKIRTIMIKESVDCSAFEEAAFRKVFFDFIDVLIKKMSFLAFEKTKAKLNKTQKFTLVISQFLLIDSTYRFLESRYGGLKDFQTRFNYSEIKSDGDDYFPANQFRKYYGSNDPLCKFAVQESQKRTSEFSAFINASLNYFESGKEKDFISMKNAFMKIHNKYWDVKTIRKMLKSSP